MSQFKTSRIAPSGFTLIEVLIGIIVLGLGLLGLAAVFPAVVVQQRQASDAIEGETLVESAKAYLRSSMALNARAVEVLQYSPNRPPSGLFRAIRDVQPGLPNGNDTAFGEDGVWVRPFPANSPLAANVLIQDNGDIDILAKYNFGSNTYDATYRIPITDRLIPSVEYPVPPGASGQPDPRFVWDFMIRRNVVTPGQPKSSDTISVAVFVRRLDSSIRRRPDRTLAEIFADRDGPEILLPVASNPDTGEALSSSRGDRVYSWIQEARLAVGASNATFAVDFANEGPAADVLRRMVAQVGQKLVGRTGVVHTVTRVFENPDSTPPNALTITVEPPFLLEDESTNGRTLFPIWFTPQVPVAVEVFDATVP